MNGHRSRSVETGSLQPSTSSGYRPKRVAAQVANAWLFSEGNEWDEDLHKALKESLQGLDKADHSSDSDDDDPQYDSQSSQTDAEQQSQPSMKLRNGTARRRRVQHKQSTTKTIPTKSSSIATSLKSPEGYHTRNSLHGSSSSETCDRTKQQQQQQQQRRSSAAQEAPNLAGKAQLKHKAKVASQSRKENNVLKHQDLLNNNTNDRPASPSPPKDDSNNSDEHRSFPYARKFAGNDPDRPSSDQQVKMPPFTPQAKDKPQESGKDKKKYHFLLFDDNVVPSAQELMCFLRTIDVKSVFEDAQNGTKQSHTFGKTYKIKHNEINQSCGFQQNKPNVTYVPLCDAKQTNNTHDVTSIDDRLDASFKKTVDVLKKMDKLVIVDEDDPRAEQLRDCPLIKDWWKETLTSGKVFGELRELEDQLDENQNLIDDDKEESEQEDSAEEIDSTKDSCDEDDDDFFDCEQVEDDLEEEDINGEATKQIRWNVHPAHVDLNDSEDDSSSDTETDSTDDDLAYISPRRSQQSEPRRRRLTNGKVSNGMARQGASWSDSDAEQKLNTRSKRKPGSPVVSTSKQAKTKLNGNKEEGKSARNGRRTREEIRLNAQKYEPKARCRIDELNHKFSHLVMSGINQGASTSRSPVEAIRNNKRVNVKKTSSATVPDNVSKVSANASAQRAWTYSTPSSSMRWTYTNTSASGSKEFKQPHCSSIGTRSTDRLTRLRIQEKRRKSRLYEHLDRMNSSGCTGMAPHNGVTKSSTDARLNAETPQAETHKRSRGRPPKRKQAPSQPNKRSRHCSETRSLINTSETDSMDETSPDRPRPERNNRRHVRALNLDIFMAFPRLLLENIDNLLERFPFMRNYNYKLFEGGRKYSPREDIVDYLQHQVDGSLCLPDDQKESLLKEQEKRLKQYNIEQTAEDGDMPDPGPVGHIQPSWQPQPECVDEFGIKTSVVYFKPGVVDHWSTMTNRIAHNMLRLQRDAERKEMVKERDQSRRDECSKDADKPSQPPTPPASPRAIVQDEAGQIEEGYEDKFFDQQFFQLHQNKEAEVDEFSVHDFYFDSSFGKDQTDFFFLHSPHFMTIET